MGRSPLLMLLVVYSRVSFDSKKRLFIADAGNLRKSSWEDAYRLRSLAISAVKSPVITEYLESLNGFAPLPLTKYYQALRTRSSTKQIFHDLAF